MRNVFKTMNIYQAADEMVPAMEEKLTTDSEIESKLNSITEKLSGIDTKETAFATM